jgi:hypothetical protein
MTQYYILKPNIVNRDNMIKYTSKMQKHAENKSLFTGGNLLQPGRFALFYGPNQVSFVFHKEWLEPAPEHLVVAARLRGEL